MSAEAAVALPLPEDAAWSRVFGGPQLPSDVLAVATAGDDVYVGGSFFYGFAGMANDTYVRVAHWDGTGWLPMGTGVNGTVHAVAVVGQDVYVGGEFTSAGGVVATHLARWDGTAWAAVAGGVSDPDRSYGTTVRALACDGERLYVGGTFTRAGDLPVRSLAVLDLATGTWSDASGGVSKSWSSEPADVNALLARGDRVLVGGSFDVAGTVTTTSVAALHRDGRWEGFGAGVTDEGMTGYVTALAAEDEDGPVFVGGSFTHAGEVRTWNLAVLRDGAFAGIGDVSAYGGKHAQVHALAVARGVLYVGGYLTDVGGASASWWARWDGTTWSAVGDGVDNTVRAMATTDAGEVVVVGDLGSSGPLRVVHGGTWTGEAWRSFGEGVTSDPFGGGTVSALVPVGEGVYLGGLFDQVGPLAAGSVARWTGTGWDTMAGGVTAPHGHGQVFTMASIGTDLYVGGRFAIAGGLVANNVARWDGTSWSTLGDGLDDGAYAMAVVGGRLYVGGSFTLAGGVRAGHLARWDPEAATWLPVGGAPTYDHDIRALAVIDDRWLVVGGTFQRFFSQGTTIVEGLWGMALFDTHVDRAEDPGQDVLRGYHLLEGTSRYGAPGWVHALEVVGGDLFVGGWFDVAGIMALGDEPSAGFPAANVAVWHFSTDGSWESVGGGTDHQVQALQEVEGRLAVGGSFSTAGAVPAARVAAYDPATRSWARLGSGLSDGARGASWALSLAYDATSGLWVGGEFPSAGARPSDNLARWTGPLP